MIHILKNFIRNHLIPDKLFLFSGATGEKTLYLTFDDGPVSGVTNNLLDLLSKHNVKATFFVIGNRLEDESSLLCRIFNDGHSIGNHSFTHPNFNKITSNERNQEILETKRAIEKYTLRTNNLFRAPQGRWNYPLLWFLFKQKITGIHWSRDSMDYKKLPAQTIVKQFKKNPVRAGEIILFHDDDTLCIEVLETLIPYWQSLGYKMKALKS